MEKVFFNYNSKINLQEIPFLDQITNFKAEHLDLNNRRPLQYDHQYAELFNSMMEYVQAKQEDNRKLIKYFVSFLTHLKTQIEIELHPDNYLVLNTFLVNNQSIVLQRQLLECAFLTKINSAVDPKVILPYLYNFAEQVAHQIDSLRQQRQDISETNIIICNVNNTNIEDPTIYLGIGFVNTKTETVLSLEEFRKFNYKRLKIPINLIPPLSKNTIHNIILSYVTILRGFHFGDDTNPNEKSMREGLKQNIEMIQHLIQTNPTNLHELINEVIYKTFGKQNRVYVIDISKVSFEQKEMIILFIINALYYILDVIWKKSDLEFSYISEKIGEKILFIANFNNIDDTLEYNDRKSLKDLHKLINKIIFSAQGDLSYEQNISSVSEGPSSNRNSVRTESFVQYFKRNKNKGEKSVAAIVGNAMHSKEKWSSYMVQDTTKNKIQNLEFRYVEVQSKKIDSFISNRDTFRDEDQENPLEEFQKMLISRGLTNVLLEEKDYFMELHAKIEYNVVSINYALLPKLYFYYLVANQYASKLDELSLVEVLDDRLEFLLRKIAEYYLYDENSLIQVFETFASSPKIVKEFLNLIFFKISNPYTSHPQFLRTRFKEVIDHYLSLSFQAYLDSCWFEDEYSQILINFFKTSLLKDNNDEFMELLLIKVKGALNQQFGTEDPTAIRLLQNKIYAALLDPQIVESLPQFFLECFVQMNDDTLHFLTLEKVTTEMMRGYLCGIYLSSLLLAIVEGKNPNYLSNTNKYGIWIEPENIKSLEEALKLSRPIILDQYPQFESQLEVMKNRALKNDKTKKEVYNLCTSVFLSGANIAFLANTLKFSLRKHSQESQLSTFLNNFQNDELNFYDSFENISSKNQVYIIFINNSKARAIDELAEFSLVDIDSLKDSLPEMLLKVEKVSLESLVKHLMTNQTVSSNDSGLSHFNTVSELSSIKRDLISNFIHIEENTYNKIKDLIPAFNILSQGVSNNTLKGYNKGYEKYDSLVRQVIRYQDDIVKYHRITNLINDFAACVNGKVNLLNMKLDYVENFSDIAVFLRSK